MNFPELAERLEAAVIGIQKNLSQGLGLTEHFDAINNVASDLRKTDPNAPVSTQPNS